MIKLPTQIKNQEVDMVYTTIPSALVLIQDSLLVWYFIFEDND